MRRKRSAASELAEIAVMAPWVIGLRLARFADTRPRARKRNLDEATRMLTEKAAAAAESGWAMSAALMRAQLGLYGSVADAAAAVTAAAVRPTRRRVKRNVKRLTR